MDWKRCRTTALLLLLTCLLTPRAGAQPVDGSFESGVLLGWSGGGTAAVIAAGGPYSATDGTYLGRVLLPGLTDEALELFLGVDPGTLDGLGYGDIEDGSGLRQIFFANAGEHFAFDWDMIGFAGSVGASIVSVNTGPPIVLDDDSSATPGFETFCFTSPSTDSIEIAIAMVGFTPSTWELLVDHLRPTPDFDGDSIPDACDPFVCGNGMMESDEECDDGDLADGDGCSSTCTVEECWQCTGEPSSCAHAADDTPCAGGDPCTTNACSAGVCTGTPVVCDDENPCTADSCSLPTGCVYQPAPASSCRTADKSLLLLRNDADNTKDTLIWKWIKGQATSGMELEDPTGSTGYVLCVYAGSANAVITHAEIPPGSAWSTAGAKGFKYKDKAGDHDGITKVIVKGGGDGKAKAQVKGTGDELHDPALGSVALPVKAQLVNADTDVCLESEFGTGQVITNSAGQFKAKVK